MKIIETADGNAYEVLTENLEQEEVFEHQWQDLAAEIDAEEAQQPDISKCRNCAVSAVLERHGRKTVLVRRIPRDGLGPQGQPLDNSPSDGISRVYSWNVVNEGALGKSLEQPSIAFFQKRIDAAAISKQLATDALAQVTTDHASLQADIDAATTLPALLTLVGGGKVQARDDAARIMHQLQQQIDDADAGAASSQAAIDAIKVIDPNATTMGVSLIEAQMAKGA